MQTYGTLCSWLIDVLNALTGHLDEPGGAMFPKAAAFAHNTIGKPGVGRGVSVGRHASRVSGAPEVFGEFPITCLAEEIETPGRGQVRALITVAGNPVLSSPGGPRLARALDGLDFMLSLDIYLNETTCLADVVLPGMSALEDSHYDVAFPQFSYRNHARYSGPVFAPAADQPQEWQTLLRLAAISQGLGAGADIEALDDALVAADLRKLVGDNTETVLKAVGGLRGPERLLDLALRAGPYGDRFGLNPEGLNLAKVRAARGGIDLGELQPRIPEVLRTPSGRIELAPPSQLADLPRALAAQDTPAPDMVVITTRNSPPVANAGPNQSSSVGSLAQLNGVASSDVDGDALTYRWSFLTRPPSSAATLSSATAVNPAFTVDQPGTYVIQLTVNDGTVDSLPATLSLTTANSPPVARAGPDQRLRVFSVAQLIGDASFDADGNALSYAWALTTRPAGSLAVLSNITIDNPTFILDRPGTYVAQLIVSDGVLNSAPDTIVVTTSNTTPVANAGDDQAVLAGANVQLSGAASADADGDPLSYAWSLTNRPSGSSTALSAAAVINPTLVADVPGSYVVQLMVNDGSLDSIPDTVLVTATAANTAPVAANDSYTVVQGGSLTVPSPGVLTNDNDNGPLTALLLANVSSGTLVLNANGGFSYTPNASFSGVDSFTYRANDGALNSAAATVSITITPANRPPVAQPQVNQNIAVGGTVQLNGSASSDPDGDSLTYAWTMSTRPPGSNAALLGPTLVNPTFVADVAGVYTLALTVNDGRVNSASASVTVTATVTAPILTSIAITPANPQVGVGLTRQFTATGTYQSGPTQDLTATATWTSSNTAAATIDATGLARGVAGGATTTITAGLGGVSGSTVLTVNALNAAPTVNLSTPAADSRLTEAVQVIGTVNDTDLVRYTLEYAVQGSTQFIAIASGAVGVTNGVLGSFDPTQLINGIYTVRLTGEDALGQRTATSREFIVDGDVKIGNFTITFTDLNIALPGLPITINRTYDSRVKQNGDFGIGWKLDLKTVNIQTNRAPGRGGWSLVSSGGLIRTWRLQSTQAHYVTISFGDGRSEIFDFVSNESHQVVPPTFWQAPVLTPRAGVTSRLVTPNVGSVYVQAGDLIDDGTFDTYNPQDYRLTTADGTVYDFTLSEGLKQLRDANNNTITISTSGIIHSAGVSVPFVRDGQNRVTQITDPNGNVLRYGYDTRGNLATFTDALTNVTRFNYANNSNLIEIRDALGRQPLHKRFARHCGRARSLAGCRVYACTRCGCRWHRCSRSSGQWRRIRYEAVGGPRHRESRSNYCCLRN